MKVLGSQAVQGATQALKGIQGAAHKTNSSMEQQTATNYKQIRSWGQLRDSLDQQERKLDAVYRAAFHLTDLGGRLVGVTEQIAGAAMGVVMAYADYDFMLRRGATALNTNAEWQEKLNQAIQTTSQKIGMFKPEEVAEGYYIWGAAAGIVVDSQTKLDQVTETVRKTMIATAMAGGTLEGNLKGVYGILSVFNLEMSESSRVIEVLTLMTERTAADFGDLTGSFSYIGPLANSLGIEFDQMAQLLGILADAGQRGSRAGRGLSMVLEGLSAPSGPAKVQLDKVAAAVNGVGATWENLAFPNGEFIGWEKIINNVAVAAENWSDAEKGAFYSKALTNNATRAFIPLIERQIKLNKEAAASGEEWSSVLEQEKYQLEGAAEFFGVMEAQALGSIHAIIGAFQNSFFPLLEIFAQAIMAKAAPVLEFLSEVALGVAEWLKQNPAIVEMILNVAGVIALVAGVAGAVFLAAGSLMMLGAGIAFVMGTLGGIIMSFGLLGAIVAGVVTAIMTNFGGLRDAIANLASAIGGIWGDMELDVGDITLGVGNIIDNISPVLEPIANTIAEWINFVADWLKKLNENEDFRAFVKEFGSIALEVAGYVLLLLSISKILGVIGGVFWAFGRTVAGIKSVGLALSGLKAAKGAVMAISAVLGGPLTAAIFAIIAVGAALWLAWENNWFGIREIVASVIDWFVETIPPIVSNIVTWFSDAINFLSEIFTNVWNTVAPIVESLVSPFVRLAEKGIPALISRLQEFWGIVQPIFAAIVSTFIETFVNTVIPAVSQTVEKFGELLSHVVPIVSEFVGHIAGFIGGIVVWFAENWDSIVEKTGIIFGIIFTIIITALELILGVVGPWVETGIRLWGILFDTIMAVVRAAFTVIEGIFRTVFGTLSKVFDAFAKLFSGDVLGFIAGIGEAFFNLVTGVLTIMGGLWEGIIGIFWGAAQAVWTAVTGILSGILGLFPNFIQDAIKFSGDFVKGIWEGITGFATWLWNKVSGFFGDLIGDILGFFGIKSPSKKFADIGKDLVRGLWEGITGMVGWITNKIQEWVGGIIDGVLGFFGISSPSKVFAEMGTNLVLGLEQGIRGEGGAIRALEDLSERMTNVGQAGLNGQFDAGGSQFSATYDNTRVIRVEVDLTSSDGAVDSLTLDQLQMAVDGGLVAAVERMAEIVD